MVDIAPLQKIIDEDLLKLKFLLKNKIASIEEIKAEEETIVNDIKTLMTSIKEIETFLEEEINSYKKMKGGWTEAYKNKRLKAIGSAIQKEIELFDKEYAQTKNLYTTAMKLREKLDHIIRILTTMNETNKETKGNELKLLQDFKTPTGGI